MIKPEILFLKQEDLIKVGVTDMDKILKITEDTFKRLAEGNAIQPPKNAICVPDVEHHQQCGLALSAYIKGKDVDSTAFGVKWAAESVTNASEPDLPLGIDVTILSNAQTMLPKALVDGTLITAMRTSATAGLCAKYCARKDSKIATLVGAGVIGRTMIMAIGRCVPSLEEIRIVDLDMEKAKGLAEEFKGIYNVVPYADTREACKDADLVVTETTTMKPIIFRDMITKSNATLIQLELFAYEESFIFDADKLVIDSWEQMTHTEGSPFIKYREEGRLTRDDVVLIEELASGKLSGRDNDDQFVFCNTMGMGSVDINIANTLYLEAKEKGIGQVQMLWDKPLWI